MSPLLNATLAGLLCLAGALAHAQNTAPPSAAPRTPPSTTSNTAIPEPSSTARALFDQAKDGIVQVRVLLRSASEQSTLGSGFLVRDDGAQGAWVVTNYHVVSALALAPQKYRIELRGNDEQVAKARLVALDVVHDLAVLKTEPEAGPMPRRWHVLGLREAPLNQGSPVFALGNPLELGFLISEGLYNGTVESRIHEQMLFSGALNSGMSGGPAIDAAGQVVGVNVATRRDGESLSFLVPLRYLHELLRTAWDSKHQPPAEWRSTIAGQLLQHQRIVTSKLLDQAPDSKRGVRPGAKAQAGFSSQELSGRTVPTLDGSLTRCWANAREGENLRYQSDRLNCNLPSSLFVGDSLYTGSLSLGHTLLRNGNLSRPQFTKLASSGWDAPSEGSGARTRSECLDKYLRLTEHTYRVAVCVRAYRRFDDLYDYSVMATQVDDPAEQLSSRLDLRGFSFENAQRLGQMFLERLR